jgi:hypothetical protein
MKLTMHPGRCLGAVMAAAVLSLLPAALTAGSLETPEEAARLRQEWEQVRERQARTIRDNAPRIAAILAKEGGAAIDDERQRAQRITQERVAGIDTRLKGGGRGRQLARAAERAGDAAAALGELGQAQDEYLALVTREWAEERKKLRDATVALEKNAQLVTSHLTRATEAALAAAGRVQESGVLEKAARSEAAAGEIRELLTARGERERAALEREREQRQRETGERARQQRW